MSSVKSKQRRRLVTILFLIVAVATAGSVAFSSYIANSKEAKKRYDALLAVDAAGGDVEKSLYELRSYIYAHMNTTIGTDTGIKPAIQLRETYNRLVQAEKDRVKRANDDLYAKAQVECERKYPTDFSGKIRVPCVSEYVSTNAIKEQPIPEGLYKYDFVSPKWSPDAAGIGMLITLVLLLALLVQIFLYRTSRDHMRMSS